jgi:hypothetical protein
MSSEQRLVILWQGRDRFEWQIVDEGRVLPMAHGQPRMRRRNWLVPLPWIKIGRAQNQNRPLAIKERSFVRVFDMVPGSGLSPVAEPGFSDGSSPS